MTAKTALLLALAAPLVAACAGSPTPVYDAHFGDAVRAARAQQTLNPEASQNPDPVAGIDGQAAREAMERYHESFKSPPPTFNVINIGGALAQ